MYGRARPPGTRTDVKEHAYNIVAADVDDMAILSSHDAVFRDFHAALVKHFDVTDLGPMKSFFGVLFEHLQQGPYLYYFLSAKKQMDSLFVKHTKLITHVKVDTPYLSGTASNAQPLNEKKPTLS